MDKLYDLIVIGAGPSGLTAALYSGRAKLKTLVIERSDMGGQIKITSDVVNYPGIPSTSGKDLMQTMRKQAESFGVAFVNDEVVDVDFSGGIKEIKTKFSEIYKSIGVIIATGAKPRSLGFEGEAEFAGRGIGFCATCDGELFDGKDVFVIGAGFAACQEAVFLTRFARKVIVIAREPEFTCAKAIGDKVLAHEKIEVKFNTEVVYVKGTNLLKEAKFINNVTEETWIHHVTEEDNTFGMFVFVGYEPISSMFKGHVAMDKQGYIPAGEDMQTDVPGVYASGDIRPKRLRQLVTATSDGAIASTAVEKYIEDKKKELGLEVAHDESANFFSEQAAAQVAYVMEKCESKITVNAVIGIGKPSQDVKKFLQEFRSLTDKVTVAIFEQGTNPKLEADIDADFFPMIALMDKDGKYSGLSFHGVPGGHELESFMLAIYNVAGPGQKIDSDLSAKIKALKPGNVKIGVSLSCAVCPDIVQACQRIGALNPGITAEMIDMKHYPELRNKFSIMSLPAVIIDNKTVLFGKKTIEELVEHLAKR